jgi:hypothetical protein
LPFGLFSGLSRIDRGSNHTSAAASKAKPERMVLPDPAAALLEDLFAAPEFDIPDRAAAKSQTYKDGAICVVQQRTLQLCDNFSPCD